MHAAIVQRQVGLLFRELFRDRVLRERVLDRDLQATGDGGQKRLLPETEFRLFDPDNVFFLNGHKDSRT